MTHIIKPGEKAPNLSFKTLNGSTLSLHDNLSNEMNIVIFYRGLHCPICKEYLVSIQNQLDDYSDANTSVTVISMDSEEKAKKTQLDWGLDKLNIGYGLSLDDAKNWGLFISKSIKEAESDIFCEPGLFVIKKDGSIYMVNISNMPFARPDLSTFSANLKFAQDNQYPVRGNY
jgi:peroxiredoxin